MKRFLAVLLGLAMGLTACAPAASETTSEAPATVETAPAEAAEETSVAPVGNLTICGYAREGEGCYYCNGIWGDPASGEAKWALFRLDYATGQRQLLQTFGPYDGGISPSEPFVGGGRVYCTVESEIYSLSPDGSEKQVVSTQKPVNWMFSDGEACYWVEGNAFNNAPRPQVKRTDLQTGVETSWELPAMYLLAAHDSRGSRVLASRCITEQPLPSTEEAELFNAVLQNATMEYGWIDLVTGDWQGIVSCPYARQQSNTEGQTEQWSYEGMNGDTLYFRRMVVDGGGNTLSTTLERCALDGSGLTEVAKLQSDRSIYPVCRGADLAWLMDYAYTGTATIYNLENGTTYENIPLQPTDSGWPLALTADGRVLVIDHYNQWGEGTYAILDADDYLAGSRDWTVFTDAEN